MYPQIPWAPVVDPLGSLEHTLGTTDTYEIWHTYLLYVFVHIYGYLIML
jgi:hypothetical protein